MVHGNVSNAIADDSGDGEQNGGGGHDACAAAVGVAFAVDDGEGSHGDECHDMRVAEHEGERRGDDEGDNDADGTGPALTGEAGGPKQFPCGRCFRRRLKLRIAHYFYCNRSLWRYLIDLGSDTSARRSLVGINHAALTRRRNGPPSRRRLRQQ